MKKRHSSVSRRGMPAYRAAHGGGGISSVPGGMGGKQAAGQDFPPGVGEDQPPGGTFTPGGAIPPSVSGGTGGMVVQGGPTFGTMYGQPPFEDTPPNVPKNKVRKVVDDMGGEHYQAWEYTLLGGEWIHLPSDSDIAKVAFPKSGGYVGPSDKPGPTGGYVSVPPPPPPGPAGGGGSNATQGGGAGGSSYGTGKQEGQSGGGGGGAGPQFPPPAPPDPTDTTMGIRMDLAYHDGADPLAGMDEIVGFVMGDDGGLPYSPIEARPEHHMGPGVDSRPSGGRSGPGRAGGGYSGGGGGSMGGAL